MLKIYPTNESDKVLNFLIWGRLVIVMLCYEPDFLSASATTMLMMTSELNIFIFKLTLPWMNVKRPLQLSSANWQDYLKSIGR